MDIATVSANGDIEVGKLIAEGIKQIGYRKRYQHKRKYPTTHISA